MKVYKHEKGDHILIHDKETPLLINKIFHSYNKNKCEKCGAETDLLLIKARGTGLKVFRLCKKCLKKSN